MLATFLSTLAQTTAPSPTTPQPVADSINQIRTMLGIPADSVLFQNTTHSLIVALTIFVAVLFVSYLVRHILMSRLRAIASKTTTELDNLALAIIADLRLWSILPIALAIATSVLVLPHTLSKALKVLVVIALGLQILLSSRIVVDQLTKSILNRTKTKDGKPDPTVNTATGIVKTLVQAALALAVLLIVLENLDIRVTPLLGALGLGGIAIALATQNILADLFASLIIVFDKPFQVGDAITVGDKSGTVESIGIKTTRIKAAGGEQIVFCNGDLLASRLHNFQRMPERRVVQTISITYETPKDKVARVPELVQACVLPPETAQPQSQESHHADRESSARPLRFDRCHLKNLGAYSLDYELVYFVTTSDYATFVREQHRINLALLDAFARNEIQFAYPTSLQFQKSAL
ncbi:MAG: mechanosensitive ion channel [Phycisphaerales bacterium]